MSSINTGRSLAKRGKKPKAARRNRAPWRDEVMARWGMYCHASLTRTDDARVKHQHAGPLQAAHIWSAGTGGPDVPENGLPMCQRHHMDKDSYRIQWQPEWFRPEQIEWLAKSGYVSWDADGQPFGKGCRHFAALADRTQWIDGFGYVVDAF